MKDTKVIEQERVRRNEALTAEIRAAIRGTDPPVCPWCDQQDWDICQHADDTKNCEKHGITGEQHG